MRRILVSAIALLAVFALAATPAVEAQGKGTIKIATQSPLSGSLAALGEGITLGTQLAVEKFKANVEKAGFKVELVPFDDQAKPRRRRRERQEHHRRQGRPGGDRPPQLRRGDPVLGGSTRKSASRRSRPPTPTR